MSTTPSSIHASTSVAPSTFLPLYHEAQGIARHLDLTVVGPQPRNRVLVTGWRFWPEKYKLAVDAPLRGIGAAIYGSLHITEGGAPGLDTWSRMLAVTVGWTYETVPADWFEGWRSSGRNPGHERNQKMVDLGHHLCIGWPNPSGGRSAGTRDCMQRAHDAGIPTFVVKPKRVRGVGSSWGISLYNPILDGPSR